MGGVRPNASKKGQIGPSTTVWAARGDGSCPNCASALQEGGKTASIHGSSGVIWRIPARITFGRSKSNVGGCRAKFNRCLRPNWRSWPQRRTPFMADLEKLARAWELDFEPPLDEGIGGIVL